MDDTLVSRERPSSSRSTKTPPTASAHRRPRRTPSWRTTALQPIPPPWTAQDVGAVAAGANSSFVTYTPGNSDQFSLTGSGSLNTGNTADGMHFVSQPVTGDCEIVARVASHTGTSTQRPRRRRHPRRSHRRRGRRADVAPRRHATAVSPHRSTAGAASASTAFASNVTAPYWVRLVRAGTCSPRTCRPTGRAGRRSAAPRPRQHAGLDARRPVRLERLHQRHRHRHLRQRDRETKRRHRRRTRDAARRRHARANRRLHRLARPTPPAGALSIALTLGGTATYGTDYTLSGGSVSVVGATATVTIPSGQTQIALTVTPLNDLLNEGNETLDLTAPAATTYSLGTPATASTAITDAPVAVLTVAASPVEGGSVTGAGTFYVGTTQPIAATPAQGWQFVSWTGAGIANPASASTTVTIDTAKTVTATFAPQNPDANANGILERGTAHFGNAAPGANPPDADPDRDGLTNLLEYALGTEPLIANVSPLAYDLEPLGDGAHLRLTSPKNPPPPTSPTPSKPAAPSAPGPPPTPSSSRTPPPS